MLEVSMKKLALKVPALTLLVLSLLILSKDPTGMPLASSQATQGRGETVKILIAAQDGAPLRILSTSVKSTEPQDFRLQVEVQNHSSQEIRAYAVTSKTANDKKQGGYTQFINLTRQGGIWKPTEIRTIEFKHIEEEPVVSVNLGVDFVEFSDGTTWGPDANNSRDLLAGQREGARAERQRIRQLLKLKGSMAVADDIQAANEIETPASPNRSQKWLEGFRAGVGSMRGRLKRALHSGGMAQLEFELNKPFDTSEENQR